MLRVKVPASTANMGPGFDALALSFELYNEFTFEKSDDVIIESPFKEFNNENNLVYKTLIQVMAEKGKSLDGVHITIGGDIPLSRGLGSSATCILAGVIGANYFLENTMTTEEIYSKAVEIEGHCDNITSQYFGGLTLSMIEDGKLYHKKLDIHPSYSCTALIPDFTLETKLARAVLPKKVMLEDAVYNLSHSMMMIKALESGDTHGLEVFLRDRLHQNYRAPLVDHFHEIVGKSYSLGAYGCFLSGAGPTIMTLKSKDDSLFNKKIGDYLNTLKYKYDVVDMVIDTHGTIVTEE